MKFSIIQLILYFFRTLGSGWGWVCKFVLYHDCKVGHRTLETHGFGLQKLRIMRTLKVVKNIRNMKIWIVKSQTHEHLDSQRLRSQVFNEVFNHLVEFSCLSKPQGQGGGESVNFSFILISRFFIEISLIIVFQNFFNKMFLESIVFLENI